MKLVEVVSGLACLVEWPTRCELALNWKQPVRCQSTPGFIVNRVGVPFYSGSLALEETGAA